MTSLSRTAQIAAAEFHGAMRSRRAIVAVLLHLLLSVLCMNGTISMLGRMERELVTVLRLPEGEKTGIVSATLWKSTMFQRMVKKSVGDEVYDDIAGRHPVELIYAWIAMAFSPLLAILLAGNRISDDLRSGAARYLLVRATRAEWAAGKFAGQVLLTALALAVGTAGAWTVAMARLSGIGAVPLLAAMADWWLRVLIYSTAWLGIALGISQMTHSGSRATALGILALFAFLILTPILAKWGRSDGWRACLENLDILIPYTAKSLLWRRGPIPLLVATGHLLSLGLLYFSLGYARLARRDA